MNEFIRGLFRPDWEALADTADEFARYVRVLAWPILIVSHSLSSWADIIRDEVE